MSEEVRDPRRTLPRAVFGAGALIALMYIAGTFADAGACARRRSRSAERRLSRHHDWLGGPAPRLPRHSRGRPRHRGQRRRRGLTVAGIARVPFVVGIDRYLPAAFGKIHPRWKTPYVSILVQADRSPAQSCSSARSTTPRAAPISSSSTPPSSSTSFPFSTCSRPSSSWRAAPDRKSQSARRACPRRACRRVDLRRPGICSSCWSGSLVSLVPPGDSGNKLGFELKLVAGTVASILLGLILYWRGARTKQADI